MKTGLTLLTADGRQPTALPYPCLWLTALLIAASGCRGPAVPRPTRVGHVDLEALARLTHIAVHRHACMDHALFLASSRQAFSDHVVRHVAQQLAGIDAVRPELADAQERAPERNAMFPGLS